MSHPNSAQRLFPFTIKNKPHWDKVVAESEHNMSLQHLVLFVSRWAGYMEIAITEGFSLPDIAMWACAQAGIPEARIPYSDFKDAVKLLSEVWLNGEEFKRWAEQKTSAQ